MSTLDRTRLRLAGDAANFAAPLEATRRASPQFWRGNDVQFEIAVFFNGALVDVSNLASMTLEIRALGADGLAPSPDTAPLMGATVTDFDNTADLSSWNDGSKQHAVVAFSAAESSVAAGVAWLSVFVVTADDPGRVVTICAGPVRVLEGGSGVAATPQPAALTYYTAAQSDARFVAKGSEGYLPDITGQAGKVLTATESGTEWAAASGGAWGEIAGDIVDQTDLADALALKAPLASPTFTGVPAAPTATTGTNTTQVATTAFVQAALADLISSAPGALDTLDELAAALGDDANFASTVTNALALKAPLASPTFTGTVIAPTVGTATDNSTKIATTAFVQAAIGAATISESQVTGLTADLAAKAPLDSPTFTTAANAPTPGGGDNSTKIATTAWVRGYTAGIVTDGSGHYVFNGTTSDILTISSSPSISATLSVIGALGVVNSAGCNLFQNTYAASSQGDTAGVRGNVLWIQATNQYTNSAVAILDKDNNEVAAFGYANSAGYLQGNCTFFDLTAPLPSRNQSGTVPSNANIVPGGIHRNGAISGGGTNYSHWVLYHHTDGKSYFHSADSSNGASTPMMSLESRTAAYTELNLFTLANGSNSYAQVTANSYSGNKAILASYSSSFSYGIFPASGEAVGGFGSGGLVVGAFHGSGVIKFATGGYNSTSYERARIDASGNVMIGTASAASGALLTVNGALQTSAPSGGTAKPWKCGSKISTGTSALDTAGYVEIEIDGNAYKVGLVTNS